MTLTDHIAALEARVTALEAAAIAPGCPPRAFVPKYDPKQRKQFLNAVADAVAQEFDVYVEDLTGRSRKEFIAGPRHAACALSYELGLKFGHRERLTFEEIGQFYGGRDHGTIFYSQKRMADLMDVDTEYRGSVEAVRVKLSQP